MIINIISFIYPRVCEEKQRKIVGNYISIVVKLACEKFDLEYHDSLNAVIESGVLRLISEDPVVALHMNPEEWMENLEMYLKKKENSG